MMKMYVWNYLSGVTANYHNGGGLLIVTNRDVQDVWDEHIAPLIWDEGNEPIFMLPDANHVWNLDDDCAEQVIVFADSGCC